MSLPDSTPPPRPLSQLRPGASGWLQRLAGLGPARARLLQLGFVAGREVHVISRGLRGSVLVGLGDARVAVDGELAAQLFVRVAGPVPEVPRAGA